MNMNSSLEEVEEQINDLENKAELIGCLKIDKSLVKLINY